MTPKFDRKEVLHYASPTDVEYQLLNLSQEFSVLGYLDVARKLVSLLNIHNPDLHGRSTMRPLWLAWSEVDNWPAGELEKVNESLEELARSYSGSFSSILNKHKETSKFTVDAAGLRNVLDAIERINQEHADATTGWAAMRKSAGLVKALKIALILPTEDREKENLPSAQDVLNRITKRMHCNSQIEYLAQSAVAWKTLKEGALAKTVGVQDSKVMRLAYDAEETFAARFTLGKQTQGTMIDLTMAELVKLCSDNTQHSNDAMQMIFE